MEAIAVVGIVALIILAIAAPGLVAPLVGILVVVLAIGWLGQGSDRDGGGDSITIHTRRR